MTLQIPTINKETPVLRNFPPDFQYESTRPGTIRRIHYPASDPRDPGKTITKYASVYLPYGYPETRLSDNRLRRHPEDPDTKKEPVSRVASENPDPGQNPGISAGEEPATSHSTATEPVGSPDTRCYDVLYFVHGSGKTAEDLIGGEGQPSVLKNILDNAMERGGIRPMILVFPTLYPDPSALFSDSEMEREFTLHFVEELEHGLIPAVESTFSTYATHHPPCFPESAAPVLSPDAPGESTPHRIDDQPESVSASTTRTGGSGQAVPHSTETGFITSDALRASRTHRAFGGFSLGAVTTWNVFLKCLPLFSIFLPFSGDCWSVIKSGGRKNPQKTVLELSQAARTAAASGIHPSDYHIFCACGSEDTALRSLSSQVAEMKKRRLEFQYHSEPGKGNFNVDFVVGGQHTYVQAFQYLYHALQVFFPAATEPV